MNVGVEKKRNGAEEITFGGAGVGDAVNEIYCVQRTFTHSLTANQ